MTRDDFRRLTQPTAIPVALPGGGECFVRKLPLGVAAAIETGDPTAFLVDLVQLATCDANGERVFGPDDRQLVAELPFDVASTIAKRAAEVNAFAKEARAALGKESAPTAT
jgi:hypothetical protein